MADHLKKGLIVEDEQELIGFLRIKLEHAQYEVDVAFDGARAIQILEDAPLDLVF